MGKYLDSGLRAKAWTSMWLFASVFKDFLELNSQKEYSGNSLNVCKEFQVLSALEICLNADTVVLLVSAMKELRALPHLLYLSQHLLTQPATGIT